MAAANSSRAPERKGFWIERSKRTIFFFVLALTVAGTYAAFHVPISVFPETNFPRVVIGVDNGVMPASQMEVTITQPIENAVNSVPGLVTVRSNTSRGSAEISLFFNWSVDMYQTLERVNAALSKVQQELPSTVRISTNRLTFATFPILGYSLTSQTLSQTELWELATYQLKPPLNRLEGVSTVTVQGGAVPEFQVIPNLARMETAGVTISDLATAIDASNIIDSPGLYEQHHQLVLALVGGQVHSIDGLRNLVVKTTAHGAPVRVGDLAQVERATEPGYTAVTADGNPAVLINITRQPSGNTVAVADEVAAELSQLRKSLPNGVTLQPFYDQSQLVRESIRSVRDAILLGLVLACVILYLFLRDWHSAIIAGLVIPVTVAVTVLVMWVLGESFNLMTLGGLAAAIGLVIDDAIVVVENIVLHRDAGDGRIEAVGKALREITTPLIGSTITPVVVFLPLITVTGVTGSFFRALALTMTAALLTSLVLALSWTPGLGLVLLRAKKEEEEQVGVQHSGEHSEQSLGEQHHVGRLLQRVIGWHHGVLEWSLRRPLLLGAGCVILVAGAFLAYRSLGSDLLPEMDEGGFILDYIMPEGSSLAETNRVLEHVERILRHTPEVENTSRRTGLQLGLAAVTEANTGDFTVKLKSDRSRSIDQVMESVREQILAKEPELDVEFTQVLQDMIGDLSNAPEPIQIKLFGEDGALLDQIAPRVAKAIGKVKGVVDVEDGVENTSSGPATNFQVDPMLAARMGFTPAEVAEDTTSILDGETTNAPLIVAGRPYTIRIRLAEETRGSLDAIENTVFNSSSGHLATLGAMTHVTELPPQHEIHRENLQQLVVVTASLEGTDLGTAVTAVRRVTNSLHLPPSVRVEYGGAYEVQQKSFADLLRVLLLALVLVFGVLLAEFRNFSAPLAILASSVLSISGVVFALLVTGISFNVASFMGAIMVIGIVAKNGILLLDADERYRREGMDPRQAMLLAAQRRLRPILMTAAAAICGMLPLAFAFGAGSQMLQPLAIAVIGGLLLSMFLSLVVTPIAYYLLTRNEPLPE